MCCAQATFTACVRAVASKRLSDMFSIVKYQGCEAIFHLDATELSDLLLCNCPIRQGRTFKYLEFWLGINVTFREAKPLEAVQASPSASCLSSIIIPATFCFCSNSVAACRTLSAAPCATAHRSSWAAQPASRSCVVQLKLRSRRICR